MLVPFNIGREKIWADGEKGGMVVLLAVTGEWRASENDMRG